MAEPEYRRAMDAIVDRRLDKVEADLGQHFIDEAARDARFEAAMAANTEAVKALADTVQTIHDDVHSINTTGRFAKWIIGLIGFGGIATLISHFHDRT